MEELKKPVRTTIYLDEETMRRCQALFEEAKTDTFSAFVRKALDCYIDYLITDQPHSFISEELAEVVNSYDTLDIARRKETNRAAKKARGEI